MSVLHSHAGRPGLAARLSGLWASLGARAGRYLERMSRSGEIRRLQAMSDAELAAIGLSRATIVNHVFRDRIGL